MAKTYSYNVTLNRLYAVGGTEIDPITFSDLWTADQGAGWGVVHYYGQNTYHLDAFLYLGDGSTPTYFKDVNKLIVFTDVITGNSVDLIYVYNNAHIQLGELENEEAKETYHGCVIQSNIGAVYSYLFRVGMTNTYRRLYGCTVISPNVRNKRIEIYACDNTRFWNCSFVNYVWPNILGDADIYRCTAMGGTDTLRPTAIEGQKGSPTIDDYVASNIRTAVDASPQYQDFKISRLKATNVTAIIFQVFKQKNDVILLDCTLTNWRVFTQGVTEPGKALRKYTVNINVADKDGANLSGATVTLKDKNDNDVFSVNTDVNGDIVEQEVTYQEWYQLAYGYHGEDEATCFSPHKFIISKVGYETLEIDNITLNEAIKWHLELQDEAAACDYPSVDDVEKDVTYDSGNKTGVFAAPAEGEVKKDVGYGANGTEFTGTLEAGEGTILIGNNLEAFLEEDMNMIGELEESMDLIGELEESCALEGVLKEETGLIGEFGEDTGLTGEF